MANTLYGIRTILRNGSSFPFPGLYETRSAAENEVKRYESTCGLSCFVVSIEDSLEYLRRLDVFKDFRYALEEELPKSAFDSFHTGLAQGFKHCLGEDSEDELAADELAADELAAIVYDYLLEKFSIAGVILTYAPTVTTLVSVCCMAGSNVAYECWRADVLGIASIHTKAKEPVEDNEVIGKD